MQWIEHVQANGLHLWTLEGPEQIAELTFSPESKAFRLHYTHHRLFFLEDVGVLQQKIALKSEYGITLGEFQPQRHGQSGAVTVNDLKYHYKEDHANIQLFDKQKQRVVSIGVDFISELGIFEVASLLFSLAWIFPAIGSESTYQMINGLSA
ncbi:hypothetical protein [Flavisolibacter tropicus]|uniref:Uncharacterized protein n=1 Tax=Flavisolibacter tropicus TaxID=1492898 RepID=A0A172U0A9_9BACT|nr:hypothetical protein [Flavisolibacter tropicus]ANE52696.1 hypothetical protein SY85_21665 [Flavisolibacter tropicus]